MISRKVFIVPMSVASIIASLLSSTPVYAAESTFTPTYKGYYYQWGGIVNGLIFLGSDKSSLVDDYYGGNCNGSYDYIYTGTIGNKATFIMGTSSAFTIDDIYITPCGASAGAGTAQYKTFYRFNGQDSSGCYFTPETTTFTDNVSCHWSNLNLGVSNIGQVEAGVEYIRGEFAARVSAIKMRVIYH
ncbi:hypothetical protein HZC53_02630 [Candidatus Uhrbacteria bacterium]|nr:hypothetical protein [Candidatus Uhrbacteria bacterium]